MEILDKTEPQARNALIFCNRSNDGCKIADLLRKDGCVSKIVTDIRDAKKEARTMSYDVIFSLIEGFDSYGFEFLKWLQDTVYGPKRVGITMTESSHLFNEVYKLGVNDCFFFHSIERDMLAECMESMFSGED